MIYFGPEQDGGRLNFLTFETERIDLCIEFLKVLSESHTRRNGGGGPELCVMATGGGAFKYYDRLKEALGVNIIQEEEMECLIIGMFSERAVWMCSYTFVGLDFFITEIPNEVFTYSEISPMAFAEPRADVYPYMLVNIGSGVSMVKVSGPRQFQRVGGTHLGGGTFWGLMSLLTGARSFPEMLNMADQGDNSGVDMLVGDIYGMDYTKIGLKSTAIASTFGKVFKMKKQAEQSAEDGEAMLTDSASEHESPTFSHEDMGRSLLYAIR